MRIADKVIDQVVPGNGAWVILGMTTFYPVMHFIYWHGIDVSDGNNIKVQFMDVELFGAKDDSFGGQLILIPFEGYVFPSKKAARKWAKENCFNGEFNEAVL